MKKKCPKGKSFNKKTKRCRKKKIKKPSFKNLSSREKKYCRCVYYLKSKKIKNRYAICTSSVYNKQGVKRKKVVPCSKNLISL